MKRLLLLMPLALVACSGVDHSSVDHSTMDHATSEQTLAHDHTAHAVAIPEAPRTSSHIARVQPEATLRADPIDSPSPVSVSEAAKARKTGQP